MDDDKRMVEEGAYGPVMIVGGRHAGKAGIYDDDDSERMALVYISPDDVVLVQRRLLEPIHETPAWAEAMGALLPDHIGFVTRREKP